MDESPATAVWAECFFSQTATASNGCLLVIASAYGALGCHQRFRSAVGSFPNSGAVIGEMKTLLADWEVKPCWTGKLNRDVPSLSVRSRNPQILKSPASKLAGNLFMGCVMRDKYCIVFTHTHKHAIWHTPCDRYWPLFHHSLFLYHVV